MRNDKSADHQCQFCQFFLSKGEFHEEFDFYKHPACKSDLIKLKEKLNALPTEEKYDPVENYAVRRGLRRNATRVDFTSEGKVCVRHEGGTVVMPGYERLLNAYKWMRKLEDKEPSEPERIAQELFQ